MNVRLATADDDPGITALMESVPMPGSLQLTVGCRPSFFQALRVEGNPQVVAVAEDRGDIVGVGAVTFRQVFINGRPATLRYLSALRLAPRARGSSALARGFACLRKELAGLPGDITITSVLAENSAASEILTSGRAGLPRYEPLCNCITRVLPADSVAKSNPSGDCCIEEGADASEIAGFLGAHGPSRNFFPVCLPGDLDGREDSAFPCLTGMDFLVARSDGDILGVMGCWDVMQFRQTRVAGYSKWLRWARPWINAGARLSGRQLLPKSGEVLGLAFVTLALIRGRNPKIFRALLDATLEWTRRRGLAYLIVSMEENDPLGSAFGGLPHRRLCSGIFSVRFGDAISGIVPDGRQPHFEGAML